MMHEHCKGKQETSKVDAMTYWYYTILLHALKTMWDLFLFVLRNMPYMLLVSQSPFDTPNQHFYIKRLASWDQLESEKKLLRSRAYFSETSGCSSQLVTIFRKRMHALGN